MIESNDRLVKDVRPRSRRKSAAWKSGLMLTGMGAVVLGAGYLAGVNAPAVAQTSTPEALAQAGSFGTSSGGNRLLAPQNGISSDDGQVFQFNGDEEQRVQGDDGTFAFGGGDNSGSSSQFNQQFGGRRSRQPRGFSQQQPNFGGPVTRSRGS